MYDAVIAGGGPAGSRVAALLAREHDVLVLEEHGESGLPVQCAGFVTGDVLKLSGVNPDILSTVFGAEVVFPDGTSVTVRSKEPKAFAIDRHQMDSRMADAAMSAGAEFSFGERYLSHSVSDDVHVRSAVSEYRSRAVIGADGHTSRVAESFPRNGPGEFLRGIQADVSVRMEHDDLFRAHLGSEWAPGFFTWEIPCGDYTRVGLCTSWSAGPPMPYLRRLLRSIGAEDKVIGMHCGKIPIGVRPHIAGNRCMLVGDAAGQVKPVSAGGLYPGLSAAGILADTLSGALSCGDLSDRMLSRYPKAFDDMLGSELGRGRRLRSMLLRMDDGDLNAAGAYASRDDVRSVLDDLEIDRPSAVVGRIMRRPRAMLAAIPLAMRCLF